MPIFVAKILSMTHFKQLDLRESIKRAGYDMRSAGDDFFIYELHSMAVVDHPFKIDDYGCCICLEGEANGYIDLSPKQLHASSMAINVPGQLLEQGSMSSNFKAIGITMSRSFVSSFALPFNFQLDLMLRNNPIIPLQPAQLESLLAYCTMTRSLLEKKRQFQLETLRHLTCAFFYGIGSHLFQLSEEKSFSHEEELMHSFLNEVKKHCKQNRKVQFYASLLNVSPGYLSTVVKSASGKSPAEWIDNFVAGEARALLKSTSMTIQQISYELGFPSQSFFGKFFKRITSVSPKEYRET